VNIIGCMLGSGRSWLGAERYDGNDSEIPLVLCWLLFCRYVLSINLNGLGEKATAIWKLAPLGLLSGLLGPFPCGNNGLFFLPPFLLESLKAGEVHPDN